MNVEIVTIGDELLLGFTVDTNSSFIGRDLASIGVAVARHTTCGDDIGAIVTTLRDALQRTGAVITTGGLGPTADDMTVEAVATLFGRQLRRDDSIAQWLEQRWLSFRRAQPMPESNYKQAMIPEGSEIIPNPVGSAPGVFVTDQSGRWVATLPGVPREARAMFTQSLRPRIAERSGATTVIRSYTLRTIGVGESAIADTLGALGSGVNGLSLAFLPGIAGVDLRLTSSGLTSNAADCALVAAADVLRAKLGDAIYGDNGESLASVVLRQCRQSAMRVAVAESCTGGMLGAHLTDEPGSSDVFHGGIVAYDNRVKRQLLGVLDEDIVQHGAVSEPVALQMAKGVRLRLGTEIGVSVTGIAGPAGGSESKPVGTVWIGVDVAEGRPPIPRPDGEDPITPFAKARLFHFMGDRGEIRYRAAQAALDMIRRTIRALSKQSEI
ncbi:MAG: competence/damage-inducible protein A [Gemmatimonadota bacterium]|nr:competence/damage-inducible protein A [Gemmatimonadota bacterium]